ncbi:UNVERIFIED_CONTAM: hypothetical protein Slati_1119900 [Sesamum latifolium]|uniref:Uncharacterized protein n=1 Tax=Sesamum latifolium TaxID=2727402 RepID=A0AAW2XCB5_9LAMI
MYPDFAEEPRNVRLGLCTDGFDPNGQYNCTYSCWPVIITPYNFPLGMCLFLTMVIPGLSNAKRLIDILRVVDRRVVVIVVFLEDHPYERNQKPFTKNRVEYKVARPRLTGEQIRDRVADISPAVEMPLTLPFGYGSDHKWTEKSIFWDLPYWATHLIQHNLDVMHIEKNVLENIFKIVMEIKGKTKDL